MMERHFSVTQGTNTKESATSKIFFLARCEKNVQREWQTRDPNPKDSLSSKRKRIEGLSRAVCTSPYKAVIVKCKAISPNFKETLRCSLNAFHSDIKGTALPSPIRHDYVNYKKLWGYSLKWIIFRDYRFLIKMDANELFLNVISKCI